jgi:hypothetical protein
MAKQIFKSILIGILVGLAFFMLPFFLVKFLIFFLIIAAICRLWWGGGRRWRNWQGYHYAYADKIRNMSDDEYKEFKEKMNTSSCNYYHGCGGYYNNCGDWERWERKENKNESTNQQKEI